MALQDPPIGTPVQDKNGAILSLWAAFFIAIQQASDALDAAHVLVTTSTPTLPGSVNLGALTTGMLKATIAAGVATLSSIAQAALTKTDDTNVTLTLGGTPATSLLAATSLTLGWTGVLSTARGGNSVDIASAALPLGSGQITFPATQNASSGANVLDDYEEGTWTPTDGSGAGLTLTVGGASYIKIGREVLASFNITYPVTASGASSQINGLPFTVNNAIGQVASAAIGFSTFGAGFYAFLTPNTTTLNFYSLAGVALTNLQLSGVSIIMTVPYQASA